MKKTERKLNKCSADENILQITKQFLDYGLKLSSAKVYSYVLANFCRAHNTTPETLLQMPLEKIEDLTEQFIKRNRNKIAPKYLNVIYNAVKTWLHLNRKIKSRKMFREIKFDKQSRKTRDVPLPNKDFIRKLCNNADLREKLVVVFYGIYALRPSLIPQITIGDVYHKDIAFNPDGTVKLSNRVWIMVKREYEGNKGNIDFPIILTSETSKWLEDYLNQRVRSGEQLTPETPLITAYSKANVDRIIDKLFRKVGFKGRNYLLRHLGSKLLKRAYEDEDLKEWLCGHKGKISAIYDHAGHTLADWEIESYKNQMNEKELLVYGLSNSQEDIIKAKIETIKAIIKDFDEAQIEMLKRELALGKLTFEQFNEKLNQIAQKSMDTQIEKRFEQLFIKMANKHGMNNNNNK
jgi:hypothetical protein